jgi:serine/threonine-protein kinase RsbW
VSEQSAGPITSAGEAVELSVPADAAYISVLRTVTASLAARRDFTIEEIDDLRIAVDEASALLLPHSTARSQLTASFGGTEDSLDVVVSIGWPDATASADLDQSSFAWTVLCALTDEVSAELVDGVLSVTLSKTRGARVR